MVIVVLGVQPAFSSGDLDLMTVPVAGHAKTLTPHVLRVSLAQRCPPFVAGTQESLVVLLVVADFAGDVNRVREVTGAATPLAINREERLDRICVRLGRRTRP
jgi:hypothetical protein